MCGPDNAATVPVWRLPVRTTRMRGRQQTSGGRACTGVQGQRRDFCCAISIVRGYERYSLPLCTIATGSYALNKMTCFKKAFWYGLIHKQTFSQSAWNMFSTDYHSHIALYKTTKPISVVCSKSNLRDFESALERFEFGTMQRG